MTETKAGGREGGLTPALTSGNRGALP